MYCPTCTSTRLVVAQRQGVEVDFCPACRGVWLDRGELDKILARAEQGRPGEHPGDSTDRHPRAARPSRDGRRRRESWLSELFD